MAKIRAVHMRVSGAWARAISLNRVKATITVGAVGVLVGSTLSVAPAAQAEPVHPARLASQADIRAAGSEVRGIAWKPKELPEVQLPAPVWPAAGTSVAAAPARKAGRVAAQATTEKPTAVVVDRAAVPERWRAGVVARLSGPASVSMNYSAYQYAYGGGWSSRLRLWSLPECALTTPDRAGCAATPLPSRNDPAAKTVTAEVTGVGSGAAANRLAARRAPAAVLVALAAAPAGDSGDFGATSLSASSTWSAGGSSGDFSWSYPMRMPAGMGGPQPEVGISYSSSSVDGRSSATNNQPSWIGEGFEYSPGFIERRYVPCSEDKAGEDNNPEHTGDLCWRSQNATMSLGGSSTELIFEAGNGWHSRAEDGSRIERLTGTTNGDDDGEHWKVTSTDGTQYFFGRNKLPGETSDTNSAWTVPVYSNHDGEPKHAAKFHDSRVTQAWRWNLDYAIDTRGNTISFWYDKETNQYAAEAKESENVSYVRGGALRRIDYGTWDRGTSDRSVSPLVQVAFDTADRCLSDCTKHDGSHWPDTPWDQECKASATECDDMAPTFWTTKRLAKVTTRIWDTTKATPDWQNVDSYTFEHSFPSPGDGEKGGLWLKTIVHAGHVGGTVTLPPVTLEPVAMRNRVLTKTNTTNNWQRLSNIYSETGSRIQVSYSLPDCTSGDLPSSPHTNTRRCYPVIGPDPLNPGGPDITEWWHKYVVTQVSQTDTQLADGHQAPTVNTYYTYGGTPAWHFADDDGLTKPKRKTWDQFRGYATVTTQVGDANKSLTKTTYLRGMHGDKAAPSGGTRTVTVPATLGSETVYDEDQYAGMVREQVTYNGTEDKPVSKTVNVPRRSDPTASRTINGDTVTARYAGVKTIYSGTALGVDGARGWSTTSTTMTVDDYGMPVSVQENGDIAKSGDETCATTSYNRNVGKNLLATVKRLTVKALPCATAPTKAEHMLADGVSFYDGATSSDTTPVHGALTRTDTLQDWTPSGGTVWQTASRATFDDFGRQLTSTDVRGNTVTTVLSPAKSLTTGRTQTNQKGWKTTTKVNPAWAKAEKVTDPNGYVTEVAYDALGRTSQVWDVGWSRQAHQTQPSSKYTYFYSGSRSAYPYVKTETLNAAGGTNVSYAIFDGLLRPRQTQTKAVGGGRIVSDTLYDGHGRAEMAFGAHAGQGEPSGTLWWQPEWAVPTQTVTHYDRASRPTAVAFRSGDGVTNIVEKWRTTTSYEGDRTTVVPPKGGTPTTTVVDTQGRTVEARQYHTPVGLSGAFLATTYGYNAKDQLTSVKDSAGNEWAMKYDVKGRVIERTDPDSGKTTSTYTAYDELESTTDARGKTLRYTYDWMGRKTGVYDSTVADANKRAEWKYDYLFTEDAVRGQLTQAIRYDNGNQYKWQARGFTPRYAVAGEHYVIPAAETGLAGTYVFGYQYSPYNGAPTGMTYPDAADLTPEALTIRYDAVSGLPTSLDTNLPNMGSYVAAQRYTAFGEPTVTTLKIAGGVYAEEAVSYERDTRRLQEIKVQTETAGRTVSQRAYAWEHNGNLLSIADTPQVGDADTQCYGYDPLQRLTSAWTPRAGVACSTAPSVANMGGPAPFWFDWTIDNLGNRTKQVSHTAAGDKTTTYTVPAPGPGVVRPHAVTATSTLEPGQTTPKTTTYGYDAAGNTTSRPGQTLTWDSEGRQATIVENDKTTTTNIYGPEGGRLVHRDSTGTTVYLPGMELRRAPSATAATAIRYYSFGGKTVAARTGAAQSLTWLFNDHHGTQTVSVNAYTQKVTKRRQQPYGDNRGAAVQWPTLKGFVGGDIDASGLLNIGARVYDPSLGRFLSVDPVQDLMDPQQWNGYSYSNNNPSTLSDPSGLRPDCGNGGGRSSCNNAVPVAPKAKSGPINGWVDNNTKNRNRGNRNPVPVEYANDGKSAIIGGATVTRDQVENLPKYADQINNAYHMFRASYGSGWDALSNDVKLLRMMDRACMQESGLCTTVYAQAIHDAVGAQAAKASGQDPESAAMARMAVSEESGASAALVGKVMASTRLSIEAFDVLDDLARGTAKACVNSFSAKTRVLMADGTTKPIVDIEVGDKVLATDPKTDRTEAREVTATHVNDDKEFTDLTVRTADGEPALIQTTQEHPFWDESTDDWVDAGDLTTAARLRASDGSVRPVTGVRSYDGVRTMYNLTVADINTYYVLAGNTPVLVHNCGGEIPWSSGRVSSGARSLDQGATKITVGSRAEAEELFLGKYQGQGYRNASGFDGVGTKQYFGEKRGTYHWDDQVGADGRVLGHGAGNVDGALPHLQVHTFDGPIVRIFWGGK
ncbi:RHS repeat-associated protein [Couchioplanes caeruleus]|uniref:RHS repeat-associated protein n=1 Tax=Couchioplanes caeruleus TaxID=56438 RepID=A0A3N1GJT5_9ACTN|nr:RHS repeat-associated protein [Couchioplanes caeruleus]